MAKPIVLDQEWLDRIALQVNGLEYGSVLITVHDGRVVQIDRTERRRFDQAGVRQPSNPQQGQSQPQSAQGGQQSQQRPAYPPAAEGPANLKAVNG